MTRLSCVVTALLCLCLASQARAQFDSANLPQSGELSVLRVTPDGTDVLPGSQIVIEFNRPVVAVGKMERSAAEIPIEIKPALTCQWRWLNTRSLACMLDEKQRMHLATEYSVRIRPGIKTLDGVTLSGPVETKFLTQRPQSRWSNLAIWRTRARPVIRMMWTQPVSKSTLLKYVYLKDSRGTRYSIAAEADHQKRVLPSWLPLPHEKEAVGLGRILQQAEAPVMVNGEEYRRIWMIEPTSDLPAGDTITLAAEAGVVSSEGPSPAEKADTIVTFNTFQPFAFLGLKCTAVDEDETELTFAPAEAENATKLCNPMEAISLIFSSPVGRKEVRDSLAITPTLGKKGDPTDIWNVNDTQENDDIYFAPQSGFTYRIPLPYGLKAAQKYALSLKAPDTGLWNRLISWLHPAWGDPSGLRDKFGDPLPAATGLTFATDHRRPNLVMEYDLAVLEKNVDSEVPIYVNNLQSLEWRFNRLTLAGAVANQRVEKAVPKVEDIQFAVPVGVRQMLDGQSGALFASLNTTPEVPGENRNRHERRTLFAQVTPYQVHLKLGHFNSAVWVTDFATGQPVANAEVEIYRDSVDRLQGFEQATATSRTDAMGVALLPGTEQIDPTLMVSRAWQIGDNRFFVRVHKGKDMALLPVWQQFAIDGFRATGTSFFPINQRRFGHMLTWGTTAQGIYHPGDTVQYKFYVRNQNNQALVLPPLKGYWLEIVDPTGRVVQTIKDITLSEFGAASGEFPLPKNAAVGWYNFQLKANLTPGFNSNPNMGCQPQQRASDEDDDEDGNGKGECSTPSEFAWTPMKVMVGDFTPVPFAVHNGLDGDLFHPGDQVAVETDAKLHSGGPYTQAQVRVTAIMAPKIFTSRNPAAAGFSFGPQERLLGDGEQIYQITEPLDDQGGHKAQFPLNGGLPMFGRLSVESAVQDDRGKYVAHQASADYMGVDRVAGLRLSKWFFTAKDDIAPQFIVVDDHGDPVKDVPVRIELTRLERVTAKVKGAGNAYVPDTQMTWVKDGDCSGTSDGTGKPCSLKASKAGEYKLAATVTDTKGRAQTTELSVYVTGRDFVLWDDESDSHIDVIADRDQYHVGDTAHYLIKNPYPGAQALITVERYGVLDSFVVPLKDSASVFDLPIKPDYLPGFYLSAVIMSPRVDKPLEAGQVDLGKPSFRMGYTRSVVKDAYKEIAVTATSDRETYRPGDKVHLSLKAVPRNAKNEPVELAVVVLDAAVFDLIAQGRAYYDPYAGFNSLDGLDLRNFSLLTQLIGRQKFEKKGATPGGDGGSSLDMRSTFKYVSYWNPTLKTDAAGKAEVEFTVPDNLTGWRVLAIATTPSDRFGLGEADFKVNRPTEIRPEMPNQVAEGDRFEARFSVMNRTQQERTLEVHLKAEGDVDSSLADTQVKTVTLKPFERTLVALPVKAGRVAEDRGTPQGSLRFAAEAGDSLDHDGLRHSIPVMKLRSLDFAANYGTTLTDRIEEPVAVPAAIHPDSGSLSVSVSPTVIGNLEGAFRYMRDYPYPCWEQLLTRGVMAAQYKTLKAYISDSVQWPGYEVLPDQTLARAAEFQAPNGGMTYFIASDEHVDPYLSAYTALGFNWLRHAGYAVPEEVERRLHDYLRNLLRHDVAPTFYSAGMVSSVRAVALAALAEDHEADLSDLQRYAAFVKDMSLFGKAHFTLAATHIKGGEQMARDTAKLMLNNASESGGKFVFNEEVDDGYHRMLYSPLRENCAVLSALVAVGSLPEGAAVAADAPFKLVRGITQSRGSRDHWENTQETMFCANGLADYSRVYEKDKPDFVAAASWADQPIGSAPFKDFRDPQVTLKHPIGPSDVGREGKVTITRQGTGRLYYATKLSYASTDAKNGDTNAGIEVHREYSHQVDGKWTLLPKPYSIRQGDVVRVDLYLVLPTARNFVVVDDPIPGGFEAVNTDLANNSKVDAAQGGFQAAGGSFWVKYNDWSEYDFSFWSFNHKELRHEAARFYSDYLPPGHYHLSYVAQAIGAGDFTVMPTLAAEMYDPDIYGKTTMESLGIASTAP